jgi:hypothetical protein
MNLFAIEANILPYIECTKLDIAEGIAVAGLMKFSRASTAPKPEFCIPTSMAIVLLTASFLKMILDTIYPSKKQDDFFTLTNNTRYN